MTPQPTGTKTKATKETTLKEAIELLSTNVPHFHADRCVNSPYTYEDKHPTCRKDDMEKAVKILKALEASSPPTATEALKDAIGIADRIINYEHTGYFNGETWLHRGLVVNALREIKRILASESKAATEDAEEKWAARQGMTPSGFRLGTSAKASPSADSKPQLGIMTSVLRTSEPKPADSKTMAVLKDELPNAIWENDRFQDGLEMIRNGIEQEQFTAYTMILEAIKSEIVAAQRGE